MLKRILGKLRREQNARRFRRLVVSSKIDTVRLGTSYGGWTVPRSALEPGAVAICAGAGEDISFDVELNKAGLRVVTVDPTPRAKRHLEAVINAAQDGPGRTPPNSSFLQYDLNGFSVDRFTFLPVGLWDSDTTMTFYAPSNPQHVSHSIVNLQKTNDGFQAPCLTLNSICKRQAITDLRLLKLDIEGAEYKALADLCCHDVRPRVVCVEFDEIYNPLDKCYADRIEQSVSLLKTHDYALIHVEKATFLFVNKADLVS